MIKHEQITCAHCNGLVECKLGDIANCQCFGISFTEGEKEFIAAKYSTCICADCMVQLKAVYHAGLTKSHFDQFLKHR